MITKERLKELIEQDKVFYWVFNKEIRILCNLSVPTYWKKNWELYGKDCFETKEEAEWHKEFGCIERPERLELPTWEEFRVIGGFVFFDYRHNPISVKICLDPVNVAPCNDCIYIADKKNEYFCKPKTKENYTLACRKAKELFLKGNVND